ncbi:23S ribosomal RNA methyltransferase Erm [Paenibacillus sp. VCA1]|uniref:23S ribosomal RNA methyltransferase Erm n=1 Tax=Paenibacillus sp. VCA1 TaxID=3039148 RepID=UPI0028711558|nr:23S ribosomal RNA methyltransferase Erm [Paenibacillus sp. VCA1]MDR9857209.1 23S ribosomal RNA methyltransferase Erm [Paenibacillus sp. VCA1]
MPKNNTRYQKDKPNFSGQHLLINKSLVQELIHLARVQRGDTVIDIGAGTGAITFPLAEKAGTVIAIENDPASVQKLKRKIKEGVNIRLKEMDVLRFELPKGPFCIVANIPYSVTTPIFEKFLGSPSQLQRAAFMIEKGAAKRFTADPVTNPLILIWRMWYDIRLARTVSPSNFSPPPRVDSAVVTVTRKKNPVVPHHLWGKFSAFASYGLRYPQLPFFEAMGEIFTPPQIAKLVKELGLERYEAISSLNEERWGRLFLAMLKHVEPYRWPKLPKKMKSSNIKSASQISRKKGKGRPNLL